MAQNRLIGLTEIAGEQKTVIMPVIGLDIKLHQRRTEDVPSVEELKRYTATNLSRLVHVSRDE